MANNLKTVAKNLKIVAENLKTKAKKSESPLGLNIYGREVKKVRGLGVKASDLGAEAL